MSTIQKVSALLAAGVWASAVAVGQPQRAGAKAVAADAFGPDYQEVQYRSGGVSTPQQHFRL